MNGDEATDLVSLLQVEKLLSEIVSHVYVYVRTGDPPKILGVLRARAPELLAAGLEEHDVEARWTVPSRRQMEEYRREASILNRQNGLVMVDEIRLSDEVVANHLKKILMDGKEIKLEESKDILGRLSQDSLEMLKRMHSGFYDTFYAQYCSEACLLI